MNTPFIYLIILNWNGKKDTLQCLSSLEKIDYPSYQIIVADNGSTDGSIEEILKRFPQITLLQNHTNLGYAEGNNRGIQYALSQNADAILLLNNDTIVSSDFLTLLVKSLQSHPKGGVFGAKSLSFFERKKIDHLGGFWKEEIGEFVSPYQNKQDQNISSEEVDYVSGCCILIRKEVFTKVGLLDPRFFLLWEESDFCARAKANGFSIWTVPESIIWHKVSASFSGKPLLHYYWWRNRLLFIEKNLPPARKKALYRKVLYPEILKEFRHLLIKSFEAFFLRLFSPKNYSEKKRKKLYRYRAGCKGICHYFFRKFGGPVTIKKS